MSPTDAIEIPRELVEHLNRGDCVLFVGDALEGGGAQSVRLASALVDACGAHCTFCRAQAKCARADACVVPLTQAAQLYESGTNRQALLDLVLGQVDNERPPSPVHHALASLPVRVIVTTAYDDRLETALRHAGRRVLSVVRDEDIPFDDPERVQLIRLHGTVRAPGSLVLTEDDSADLFARLPTVTSILRGHFASKTLLFVGYHLADPYFRLLYRQVTVPIDRIKRLAYALQWPPNEWEAARWHGKIAFIETELLPFLTELRRTLRAPVIEPKPMVPRPSEPYKFLDYYTRDDEAIFFGRDLEADQLLSMILAHQLTVFYGRSGTGKTSLLLARVIPALEKQGYCVAYARMLGEPAAEVKAAYRGVPAGQLAEADRERRLWEVLADVLPPGGRLVVVLDQFEEFSVRQGDAVRRAFAGELAECLRRGETSSVSRDFGSLDIRFVFSLRDDYLGSLDELSATLPQDLFAHRYRLENLTRDKALQAILKPAEAFGLPFEEPLRERLIADLEDQGLEPASLQIVLYRLYCDAVEGGLWSQVDRQGTGLTLARYEALGGTRDILAGYLDEVLDALPGEAERKAAQAILKSMVTADRTKAPVSSQEIGRGDLVARVGLDEELLEAVLGHLRDRRVVRKFGDQDCYELAHEVMVDKVWAWVSDEELRLLDVRDMLRRAMSDYQKFGHLLTNERLGLVTACCEDLALAAAELDLLFRSALAAGHEVEYWFERACQSGVAAGEIALEGLRSDNFRSRAAAVTALGKLGAQFVEPIIGMLADDYPQVRAAAIHALERLRPDGAWRTHLAYECYVPAGEFIMGESREAHRLHLDAFYIGRYPVTNADYKRYMDDLGRAFDIPKGKADHPVVEVSWYDARDYATWAGMRLLTEAEWEKAASWQEARGRKRRYPWGNRFGKKKCNTYDSWIGHTTPVGSYSPQGDSFYGCADMAGNVWEWTSSLYWDYPYRVDDGREDMASDDSRVLRGGSFRGDEEYARAASRREDYPDDRYMDVGVRVGVAASFSPTS